MQLVNEFELSAIRNAVPESQLGRLRDALRARTIESTSEPRLVHSSFTQEWYHLVWEIMSDAAFVYKLDGSPELGQWIHDRTLEIVRISADEWIGPWFRARSANPIGRLETAHIASAVCEVCALASDLFDDNELNEIYTALQEKALPLCKAFLEGGQRNNWYCVLLNGYAFTAATLDDSAAVEYAIECYNEIAMKFYDSDGYGESLQYSNYASLSLSNMRRVLVRYDEKNAERLPLTPIANTVKWAVSSHFYMKPIGEREGIYPRSANFGDCASIFRPTAEVLLQISAEHPDREIAGLARWLFDLTYANPSHGTHELATFGFFNHFGYQALLFLPRATDPISPEEARMPLKNIYMTGTSTLRDSWTEPQTILAVQTGYEPHNACSHRHYDQNSFILVHRGERYFADPGHCCYRLDSWKNSRLASHHNTWEFEDADGNLITQELVKLHEAPLTTNVEQSAQSGFEIISSDSAAAYGEHFSRCERSFVAAFPNVLFIVDRIKSDIEIKLISHFVLNNRENQLKVHEADPYRLVLRRGDGGIKFFTFLLDGDELKPDGLTLSRRWGFIHDNYHPLPNQIGQGKEGSATIYDYTSNELSKEFTVVHAIAMDGTETVKGWHIKPSGNSVTVSAPKNTSRFTLTLTPEDENPFTAKIELN